MTKSQNDATPSASTPAVAPIIVAIVAFGFIRAGWGGDISWWIAGPAALLCFGWAGNLRKDVDDADAAEAEAEASTRQDGADEGSGAGLPRRTKHIVARNPVTRIPTCVLCGRLPLDTDDTHCPEDTEES